jgi:ABC-type nitrate/sulfonate/bicarbonate transport system permease component
MTLLHRARSQGWIPGLIAVFAVLALWELVSRGGVVDRQYFPSMTDTFSELGGMLDTGEFWTGVANTLKGWALGLGIASGLAIPLGIVIGSSPLLYRALRVPIEFLRPIPSVSLVPVALLIYGVGLESKVFLAAFASFWPLFMQTLYGVQDIDPVATDTARSFGIGRFERLWRIKLPSSFPYIVTGIRISSAVALFMSVTAELVIGSPGLGRLVNETRAAGATEAMYALIITTGILGLIINIVTTRAERRLLHWHPSQREAVA